jgi:hypothetical protein
VVAGRRARDRGDAEIIGGGATGGDDWGIIHPNASVAFGQTETALSSLIALASE